MNASEAKRAGRQHAVAAGDHAIGESSHTRSSTRAGMRLEPQARGQPVKHKGHARSSRPAVKDGYLLVIKVTEPNVGREGVLPDHAASHMNAAGWH